MTSQVCADETVTTAVGFNLQQLTGNELKWRKGSLHTWAVMAVSFIFSHGLICSFSSSSSPIPAMIAHHASVYLVQLPGTDWGQVGPGPVRPSASPKRFSSQALFLFLSMAEPGSRSCQVHWGSVGKREGRVSRRAVHVYYFRLLAVSPQDFEEKASNGKLPAVYSECNKRVSVSFWKCSKRTFSLSEFGQTLKLESKFLTVRMGVYISLCMLDIWWHMLSSTAEIKVKAKCWKPHWWRVGVCVTVLN